MGEKSPVAEEMKLAIRKGNAWRTELMENRPPSQRQ